jgi:adenylate cyclase
MSEILVKKRSRYSVNKRKTSMHGQRYSFEGWTLDCARGVLVGERGEVALRPKSFEVLRFLVENADRLVSRDDVLAAVWPGVTVTEESLTQCVSEVRNALRDSEQRIIKTVPKRGYCFTAAVTISSEMPSKSAPPPSVVHALDGPLLVVLPFANLSGDDAQDYLSDGITEDIINGLSYFSSLSVIARNTSFSYKSRAVDVREIGRQLGVQYVIEGSVRRFGGRIRITAQLADAQSGVQRWSERFDRDLGDLVSAQDDITEAIVRMIVAHLSTAEEQRAARKPPTSWTAYDLLMRGDHAWRKAEQSWLPQHLYEAHELFEQAYKADPNNATICARLSLTFVRAHADPTNPECGDPVSLRRGYDMAVRAVSLDPNLPFARARLGWAFFWMKQLDDSIREFEKAVALNRNFSDVHFPAVLNFGGEPARAMELLEAQARLDPFHPSHVHAIQGHSFYLLRRYEDAIAPLTECIRRGPHGVLGHIWLAASLVRLGQPGEAKKLIAEVLTRLPHLTIGRWGIFSLYRNPADSEHMISSLNQAGLH